VGSPHRVQCGSLGTAPTPASPGALLSKVGIKVQRDEGERLC